MFLGPLITHRNSKFHRCAKYTNTLALNRTELILICFGTGIWNWKFYPSRLQLLTINLRSMVKSELLKTSVHQKTFCFDLLVKNPQIITINTTICNSACWSKSSNHIRFICLSFNHSRTRNPEEMLCLDLQVSNWVGFRECQNAEWGDVYKGMSNSCTSIFIVAIAVTDSMVHVLFPPYWCWNMLLVWKTAKLVLPERHVAPSPNLRC